MRKVVLAIGLMLAFIGLILTFPKSEDLLSKNLPYPKTIRVSVDCGGKFFDVEYTCLGKNVNPRVVITSIPKNAKELVLILFDPDAPKKNFVHWVLYNLKPNDTVVIPPNLPKVPNLGFAYQGKNDFYPYRGKNIAGIGYDGPYPPRGEVHRYVFRVFALKERLNLPPGKGYEEVLKRMEGKIVAYGVFICEFGA